jgi:antitoxin (DNA-binding transcriptional repressor) of toxin-antitoxin stability system
MRTVSLEEAQLHLGELLEEAKEGEPFLIARDGKTIAEVVKKTREPALIEGPETKAGEPISERRLGFYSGKMIVPDDFDAMFQDEIEKMFYGEE